MGASTVDGADWDRVDDWENRPLDDDVAEALGGTSPVPQQCLLIRMAAALLMAGAWVQSKGSRTNWSYPSPSSVFTLARRWRGELLGLAAEASRAMLDWPAPHTQIEVDAQMHSHDVETWGHPKDWMCLAMFPLSGLVTCTAVILRIGKDGRLAIELLTLPRTLPARYCRRRSLAAGCARRFSVRC